MARRIDPAGLREVVVSGTDETPEVAADRVVGRILGTTRNT
jgi:hypothetical protein